MLAQLWQSDELYQPLFSSSPIAVLVFIVLLGAALLVAGWRHRAARLSPGWLTFIVGLAGVLASSLAWLLLSMHQRDSIEKQASYLLDSVQLNAEQAMTEQLRLMQRMAERLEIVSADQGQSEGLFEQDAQNYFRDTLSLIEIALADDQGRVIWSQGRNEENGDWLLSQLSKPTVQSWLSIPFERPRLLVPDNQQRSMMLMAIPVSSQSQQLLAAIDLSTLLNNELRLALGPFQVSVSRGEQLLLTLHPSGFARANITSSSLVLASRLAGLPGALT